MLKPTALASMAAALKAKLPEGMQTALESHRLGAAAADSLGSLGGASTSAAPAPPPPLSPPPPSTAAVAQPERDVGDLTKAMLRQQTALEEVRSQLSILEGLLHRKN